MAGQDLPHDATIRSVRERLRDPEDYLCGVLRRRQEWRNTNAGQDSYVTIGVMGGGRYPNYRLTSPLDGDWGFVKGYNGRSHKPLHGSVQESNMETWSFSVMTREDVGALLGEVRSVKRRGIT